MLTVAIRKARTLLDAINDFQSDPLASFAALEKGLQERLQPASQEIVNRVMTAYIAAKRDQRLAGPAYQPSGEWALLIERKLKALDREKLSAVLSNFFRNEAFEGLSDYATVPHLQTKLNRVHFINNMLHDCRVWRELVNQNVDAVRTPWIGNPFGYFIDDTLAVPGCFRHHYMANKATALLSGERLLAEIGGGYAELGYFALQSKNVHYIDFDLPEVLMVGSFWLCSALPDRKIVLYGESDTGSLLSSPSSFDAALLPNFCLRDLKDRSVDVFLNTRSLSEMAPETIHEYLGHISRCCNGYFLHENSDKAQRKSGHTEVTASSFVVEGFRLLSKTISPWRAGAGRYREFLLQRECK